MCYLVDVSCTCTQQWQDGGGGRDCGRGGDNDGGGSDCGGDGDGGDNDGER